MSDHFWTDKDGAYKEGTVWCERCGWMANMGSSMTYINPPSEPTPDYIACLKAQQARIKELLNDIPEDTGF